MIGSIGEDSRCLKNGLSAVGLLSLLSFKHVLVVPQSQAVDPDFTMAPIFVVAPFAPDATVQESSWLEPESVHPS